jgi:hypothetical protein
MEGCKVIEEYFKRTLPLIEKLDLSKIHNPVTFIGSAGFEDRCFSFLDALIKSDKKIENVIGIEYRPFNPRNRKEEFQKLGTKAALRNKVKWVTYDRFDPEKFYHTFGSVKNLVDETANVIIDISGMSKFLIVVLLDILKDFKGNVIVIYSEAEIYHPTPEKYKSKKEEMTGITPTFLTKDVYKIALTTSLSSIAMQSSPLLMIAFPTFNYKELMALLSEMTPQYLIEFEGVPHEEGDQWRFDAVRGINRKIDKDFIFKIDWIIHEELSTFDYIVTVAALDEIYKKFKYTHKCVIAPTGSKLQSVGVFIFKQLHPEVQIVYPVTKEFAEEYTEGCRNIWVINFLKYHNFIKNLEKHRRAKLISLKEAIEAQKMDEKHEQ